MSAHTPDADPSDPPFDSSSVPRELPYGVWLHIFSYLDIDNLRKALLVCREWWKIGTIEELWRGFARSEWPEHTLVASAYGASFRRLVLHRNAANAVPGLPLQRRPRAAPPPAGAAGASAARGSEAASPAGTPANTAAGGGAVCHWRFNGLARFYACRLLHLEMQPLATHAGPAYLRLYFDARGEADLRGPRHSSLAVAVLRPRAEAEAEAQQPLPQPAAAVGVPGWLGGPDWLVAGGLDWNDAPDEEDDEHEHEGEVEEGAEEGVNIAIAAAGPQPPAPPPPPQQQQQQQQQQQPRPVDGGWPAAPCGLPMGSEPLQLFSAVRCAERPTGCWLAAAQQGHYKGCLEWSGPPLTALLRALRDPACCLVFVYANDIRGLGSRAYTNWHSPDYSPALLLGPRAAAAAGAGAFLREWRRMATYHAPGELLEAMRVESEAEEVARWADLPPHVTARGAAWWVPRAQPQAQAVAAVAGWAWPDEAQMGPGGGEGEGEGAGAGDGREPLYRWRAWGA